MKRYDVSVTFEAPYPKTCNYSYTAGSFATAAGKALRDWKAEVKKITKKRQYRVSLIITATKLGVSENEQTKEE